MKKEDIKEDIKNACEVLSGGGVILYPTDTVWGLGCDATNPKAVSRVYEIKQRVANKPMLVLIDYPQKVLYYAKEVPDIAWDLVDLIENPLTIIYPGGRHLDPTLLAEDGSVGIRITREIFSNKLCRRFRKAIVSTSANRSGQPTPANFSEVSEEIKSLVDYVVTYRQDDMGSPPPSSVIKLGKGGIFKIIR
jgi:L-threonylcarbamoyladenylate synthase